MSLFEPDPMKKQSQDRLFPAAALNPYPPQVLMSGHQDTAMLARHQAGGQSLGDALTQSRSCTMPRMAHIHPNSSSQPQAA